LHSEAWWRFLYLIQKSYTKNTARLLVTVNEKDINKLNKDKKKRTLSL
jgi:hypothetical protein